MEFVEMETKEDILAVGELEHALAPEVYSGDALEEYLATIERDVRFAAEAGEEYYLICSGGPVGFFALRNEGTTVYIDKAAILPNSRGKGLFRRTVEFIEQTYDPLVLRLTAQRPCPAAEALGFSRESEYYEKRYE